MAKMAVTKKLCCSRHKKHYWRHCKAI